MSRPSEIDIHDAMKLNIHDYTRSHNKVQRQIKLKLDRNIVFS